MCICGINSRFQLLSPCAGQVTHVLLTHPPLRYGDHLKESPNISARLACVRHAASVHPEPGSNSLKNVHPWSQSELLTNFSSLSRFHSYCSGSSRLHETCKEFSRSNVFHCSVINVPRGPAPASAATLIGYQTPKPLSTTFLFYYQSFLFSAPLFCGAEDILALTRPFGKHYFCYFLFFSFL